MNKIAGIVVAGGLSIVAACNPEPIEDERPALLPLNVSIREIMIGVITPATNFIWERSFAGDLSEEDWQRFSESAIQISLSASAIALAPPEDIANASIASGDMGDWREWSGQLAELALVANAAAETQDQAALVNAGDAMVELCEACHTVYLTGAQ